MIKGLYHRKLIRIFISIAIVFIIVFTILFCVLAFSLINTRNAALRTSIQTQFSLARTSLSVINYTIANLVGGSTTQNWANEIPGTNEYYFNALKLYQEIQHLTSQLDDREYEIAITSMQPGAFVVTKNGTLPKQWYFENESYLSWQEALEVYEFFETNKGALLLPLYDTHGKLDMITYVLKASYFGGDLLFFTYIPAQTLFENPDEIPFFLLGTNGSTIYSTNDQHTIGLLDTIISSLPMKYSGEIDEFSLKGYKAYADKMPNIGITIGFVDNHNSSTIDIWIFFLC